MSLPPKPQQHHRHSTCHRHPTKPITGFCASCLRERLSGIDPDTHLETPVTRLSLELRRSKSQSSTTTATTTTTTHHNASSSSEDSRRKSCDIRPRNSLSDLFNLDDKRKLSSNRVPKVVNLKEKEEIIENGETEITRVGICESVICTNVDEIEEEDGDFKTMKELIDLEWEKKRNSGRELKEIAGNLWEAASFLSKKLGKWQRKQRFGKLKKLGDGENMDLVEEIERKNTSQLRETRSEIGEYGFGRRSCDTEPRLSIDVARFSFDEPRASWDGCLIGGKTYPRLTPMVSVVEDVNVASREDVEHVDLKNSRESSPGGTMQTRDYYSERRRWHSFDRCGSNKRMSLGDDEMKSISNAKVSPETVGLFHGAKLLVTETELKNSNWYSLKDSRAENVDSLAKDGGSAASRSGKNGFRFGRWSSIWKMWSLLPKKNESKFEAEAGNNDADEDQLTGSLETSRGVTNREFSGIVSQKLLRSYTVSARDSSASGIEAKEDGLKRREELVLQRNRSARYSPNNLDNGLLRFYLTPLRGSRRSISGKSRFRNPNAMPSNVS